MYFKLKLSDEENTELEQKAKNLGLDKTAYIKKCLNLEASANNIFTAEYALELARKNWNVNIPFTLYELYGDDWHTIQNGIAGVLGRNFYTLVTTTDVGIKPAGKKEVVIAGQPRLQNQYILKKFANND
jgi:hypothetical protein